MRRRWFIAALVALGAVGAAPTLSGEDRPAVVITPGEARLYRVALQRFADVSAVPDPKRAQRFRDAMAEALEFSSVFRVLDPSAYLAAEESQSLDEGPAVFCFDWTQIGADVLVEGQIAVERGELYVDLRIWDTARCTTLPSRLKRAPVTREAKLAKRGADEVVLAFTGKRGVAGTELAFVSDRGGNTEVYVMDADGKNVRPATRNGSINTFPSWSPDGGSILYTSFKRKERPALYLATRDRGRAGRFLEKLDSGAPQYRGAFDPTAPRLALSMSVEGAPEIFTVLRNGRRLQRLTRHWAIDISPSWSPDGKQIAFVSDRSGSPQIYVMDDDGSNLRRLTYQGSYNTSPAWSPDGRWIAYETRLEAQFDIWLIDPAGTTNLPLVSHPRSDEQPSWAPNGRKLAFVSTRRGRPDIYVVDANGENLRRITHGEGRNTSPSWGPFPR